MLETLARRAAERVVYKIGGGEIVQRLVCACLLPPLAHAGTEPRRPTRQRIVQRLGCCDDLHKQQQGRITSIKCLLGKRRERGRGEREEGRGGEGGLSSGYT